MLIPKDRKLLLLRGVNKQKKTLFHIVICKKRNKLFAYAINYLNFILVAQITGLTITLVTNRHKLYLVG